MKQTKEERAAFIKALTSAADQFAASTCPDELIGSHFDLMERFSFRNVCLILSQNPEAQLVAGYGQWKEAGRQVQKGEKGLYILAPVVRKAKEAGKEDSLGFRTVAVFDISQTMELVKA